ncbi:helix-turn-helix transcriptional regulator [Pontibacter sp. KCTC 32443]|uniref:helix-turn-helix transcriptional regulator n=1 Tax=Pontibacter TaxID=323449 RepID=UPI00164DFC9E|nr:MULTISPECIES: helix-turn-helix transcriptional regulator [Pontibacter]MBC5775999.1 helix-turn-helix transcriptional regulator [Pontibacter sp. KCTC 32443]
MKNNIKVERAKKNITQEQLAESLGVSRQTINAIEKNKYLPSTLLSLKMSALFGVTVNELFILEDED